MDSKGPGFSRDIPLPLILGKQKSWGRTADFTSSHSQGCLGEMASPPPLSRGVILGFSQAEFTPTSSFLLQSLTGFCIACDFPFFPYFEAIQISPSLPFRLPIFNEKCLSLMSQGLLYFALVPCSEFVCRFMSGLSIAWCFSISAL